MRLRLLVLSAIVTIAATACLPASPPEVHPLPGTTTTAPPPVTGWPAGLTWQWQISGTVNTTIDAQVYDIDGLNATAALISTLHSKGRRVVCYLDMGSAENYRPDYSDFAAATLSNPNPEWPAEQWINPHRLDVQGPTGKTVRQVLTARIDTTAAKRCDAVEPDMIEVAYASGVKWTPADTISPNDQIAFNRWIAQTVHDRGMAVALKGDRDQAAELVDVFDFAIQEQVYEYGEADMLAPFSDAGKAVLIAEYKALQAGWCTDAKARGYSLIGKRVALGATRRTCP